MTQHAVESGERREEIGERREERGDALSRLSLQWREEIHKHSRDTQYTHTHQKEGATRVERKSGE